MLTGLRFSFRSHPSPNPQMIPEKLRQAQFVASASLYDKRVLVHWCGEPIAGKIHVTRLGVPLDRYVPEVRAQRSGVSRQDRPTPDSPPLPPHPPPLLL